MCLKSFIIVSLSCQLDSVSEASSLGPGEKSFGKFLMTLVTLGFAFKLLFLNSSVSKILEKSTTLNSNSYSSSSEHTSFLLLSFATCITSSYPLYFQNL
jgi:hypothetical protein